MSKYKKPKIDIDLLHEQKDTTELKIKLYNKALNNYPEPEFLLKLIAREYHELVNINLENKLYY